MDSRLVLALLLMYSVEYLRISDASLSDETPPEQSLEKSMEDDVGSKVTGSCETLPSKIKVTKEEHDHLGNVIRVCEGNIIVNKCEGTCLSQLKPSVTTATGFLKVLKVYFIHILLYLILVLILLNFRETNQIFVFRNVFVVAKLI